jgi:hypothetical protein
MGFNDQRVCLWLTVLFCAAFATVVATFPGFFPPMSPTMTAQQVANFYRDHTGGIRASMIALNIFGVMLVPFYMMIVTQITRMAHPSRALAYSYLAAAAGGVTLFAVADLAWLIAAFRPARDPELVQMLNDFAWFAFVAPVGLLVAQDVLLALSVYLDRGPIRVFPRWVAHFNIAAAILIAPGAFAVVFQTGPLAWNGLLAFWAHFGAFVVYILVMLGVMWAIVERQVKREESDPVEAVQRDEATV